MYLLKDKLQHISTITHEGKIVVFATDAEGKISYTVKQDGFEDSYLNTPADQRTGWESWKTLEFPDEADDQSVIEKEKAELTDQQDTSRYLLKSLYKTENVTAVAPVQVIAALEHIYVFRQSTSNTLLVDRFVLDGMTNKLNRKLEVRFKRSKRKHTPTKNMQQGSNGLVNVDTLDFRDANGKFFYEPTTELCLVNNLHKGWFSVVLVPTIENDVYRWHIFAYNSQTKKVELTTIRASEAGLFEVKDYTVFEESKDSLVPRKIPGVIKRTLDIKDVTVTNGLSATKYDLQQAQETQSGEEQLLKTATRLMLAIPTDKGAAVFSFAIAGDGTLGEINKNPDSKLIRSRQREVLLPLNTLDEIKAIGDTTPPPQGIISGFAAGTDEEDIEDLVKISTDGGASGLANYDLVKISGTSDYQGLYPTIKVDKNTFDIDIPLERGLGYWEKEDQEEGGLIFDGMITAYQKTADGKLRVTCANHGLENGDQVQITGTEDYKDSYPVRRIDDTHFVIERKWAIGEAVNVKLVSQKRRGIVFDGVNDYVSLPEMNHNFSEGITVEAWVWYDSFKSYSRIIDFGDGSDSNNILLCNEATSNTFRLRIKSQSKEQAINVPGVLETGKWIHLAATIDASGTAKLYKNGEQIQTAKINLPSNLKQTNNYIGKSSFSNESYFQGKISDVRLWKIARTAEDIKNSMYLQLTGKEVGLVGYWRLGGISEGKVVDFSVNGNDGTVYGEPYVSAATLSRTLGSELNAVKYSNSELFAVSERATYEESFEFKVNSRNPVNLAYLDNADGKNIGTKIFTFSYWGKTSRSAEDKKTISAVQNKFEVLGNGWYRASCNVTIPDEVSVLRSFEIANVKGNWQSLEIRKHQIRLLSDSITEAKYTDDVTLTTLVDNHATLAVKLKELEVKEKEEIVLLKEKRELDAKLAALQNLEETRNRVNQLKLDVSAFVSQEGNLNQIYNDALNNPLNYWCFIQHKQTILFWEHLELDSSNAASVELISSYGDDWTKWKFLDAGGGYYYIQHKQTGLFCQTTSFIKSILLMLPAYGDDWTKWKFTDAGGGYYYIQNKQTGRFCEHMSGDYVLIEMISSYGDNWTKWKLQPTKEQTNDKIERAYRNLEEIRQQLSLARTELNQLEQILKEGKNKEEGWRTRLVSVNRDLTSIQTSINTLNTTFLTAVKNTQAKPPTMPEVAKDSKGLVTQGSLLGFVQPASRLNAIETCEGNVQLSYFDRAGRMRQTNYDATADSKNATFEQWIPDAQRACLNFSNSNSIVTLNKPFYLADDWSVEAWFVYPLPDLGEWNTLIRGNDVDHHILLVRNRKQLGTYLTNDSLGNNFYDSGFNMELLTEGWHHIAAVGRGDTTLFYIDGKKVGDVKAKALKDAEQNLTKNPNDEGAKKKVEDLKKASLKAKNNVAFIGNRKEDWEPFGKVAEVRIWVVALSDDEIAVNSKTLLSGNEPGLLAYYPMNEATGVEVRDHSGNGNKATVSGADWWGCTAPIGNPGHTVMKFDGVNDYIATSKGLMNNLSTFTLEGWVKALSLPEGKTISLFGQNDVMEFGIDCQKLVVWTKDCGNWFHADAVYPLHEWHHVAVVGNGTNVLLYLDGVPIKTGGSQTKNYGTSSDPFQIGAGVWSGGKTDLFNGNIAEVRIWKVARTQAEIQADTYKRLSGKEPNLVAYYPLNEIRLEGSTRKVLDLVGNNHGTVYEAVTVDDNTLPIGSDALVSAEYSTVTLESSTKTKVAIMRRFFAYPTANGVTLLPDKRIETLELKWIGNAQFAPTLLGYIEGPPPVPSENLTLSDDYNGATSVELTISEDVAFSWNRAQDHGLGATTDTFTGAGGTMSILTAPMGMGSSIETSTRVGFKGNLDFSYQYQNESNITSSSSLSMTDKLELRGTPEETTKFPHLGTRFIPKNIGYALVVSALADVFVTRLARSGRMVGYQVQPVDGIPPDVNTITFLMNPAYTMNGSLDGMTGSIATSDRFFKHVPEMRSQYGSLYPASYYRLKEAYDLKRQIEAEDKRRESYFSNFDVRSNGTSLDRNIDSGPAPTTIGVQREEDKPSTQMTDEEKKKEQDQKVEQFQADAAAASDKTNAAAKAKQAEIQSKINDQEKRAQAIEGFASWQKRMEDIQIRAGKRNIVNTYVWDADGGLRTEAQSFANTVEHTIGGSFAMNAGLGVESSFSLGADIELTAQATVNLTQTMSKTEARSKGFQLNVDLSGLEYKGITDYNDRPILPGEKVDRYRFMSFYLEGSTDNFHDFFNYVVDPEWLRSNDEEARALRETQAGKPNKAWRVLHRVTYVERPALMGFGRDVRKLRAAAAVSDNQALLDKIAKLEEENQKLEKKLDTIIDLLKGQK
ncbi:MAG: RICIN domain-containing protein [Microcystis sp. M54BS1]|uniref:LamG-like jellyroll fold domain-containing protein n=1 Tax=unclassified Microcystis TaxID=2643300 RepID=UPI00257C767B|nr:MULTISPECIES: LamG-like jellyroll fold domain-containing protein [unclassified Microcystis]MCA2538640.1 RICIN domain-containing protein [Microcystis sp. M54BS1]MCA2598156.1 RICIN domain-containing protein [Microcystis sp. M38BS1]MCA2612759.1 RICIN domain-containing protein [Microcystis sp. M27BS1]MCA2505984.1 RICIN domain-containing protein [Microcystis sp. M62BS1]MCA2512717.1 RICIN domain-containing protein [Microcystis sp. M60BS1]